jgi:hypothetical protein
VKRWRYIWIVLVAIALGVEAAALMVPLPESERGEGASASRQVWLFRISLVGRLILMPFFAWLNWHWFIEPNGLAHSITDDLVAVAVGVLLALTVRYKPRPR